MRGSDDAEAMLADEGYGDLPAEIFGQALSSYADTAPMDEADALSPVLTTLDAGNASDVFALLEERPLTLDNADGAGLGASLLGATVLDEVVDDDALEDGEFDGLNDFGAAAPDDETEEVAEGETADQGDELDESLLDTAGSDELSAEIADDPFSADDLLDTDAVTDTATEFEEEADFFDTEPVATGEDPSDLDF